MECHSGEMYRCLAETNGYCTIDERKEKKITPAAKIHSFRSNGSVGHGLFLIGQLMRWTAQELAVF